MDLIPTREWKDVLYTILLLLAKNLKKSSSMYSHHNNTLNFSHAPYKNKTSSSDLDREIKLGELRLRYVQLMRDFHTSMGEEDAADLIKESVAIWEKLSKRKKI